MPDSREDLVKEAVSLQKRLVESLAASGQPAQRSETRWRGASRVIRSLSSWLPKLGSALTDLPARERETLAARSHDAYRNHLLGGAAVARARTNIVGTGLIMHPAVNAKMLGISDTQAEELNGVIAEEWPLWADDPRECDAEAMNDFYGQQGLVLMSALLSGDAFAVTPFMVRSGGIYGLKVQLIDAARISNPSGSQNSRQLVDGIALDGMGAMTGIYVRRKHPDEIHIMEDGWDFVPAWGEATGRRRVMQVWNDKDRIGLVRGAPYLAPILEPLQTLETYTRAELVAAVIAGLFTVFLEKDAQQYDANGLPASPFDSGDGAEPAAGSTLELGNGAIVDLAPGEKANTVNPGRPNSNYDPFFLSICKQIGARLEIPVDELLLKYEDSYSAARAAMLQAWRFYTTRRWFVVQQFCQPIYQLWFDEAVARGRIPVSGYTDPVRRAAYTSAVWVGPARGSMDEEKEARAAKFRIEAGVSNETIETAAMTGEDWRRVYDTRRRERMRRQVDGMPNESSRQPAPPPQENPE